MRKNSAHILHNMIMHDANFNIKVKFKANNGTFPKEIIFSVYNRLSLPLRASRSNEVAESVPHY